MRHPVQSPSRAKTQRRRIRLSLCPHKIANVSRSNLRDLWVVVVTRARGRCTFYSSSTWAQSRPSPSSASSSYSVVSLDGTARILNHKLQSAMCLPTLSLNLTVEYRERERLTVSVVRGMSNRPSISSIPFLCWRIQVHSTRQPDRASEWVGADADGRPTR